MYERQFIFGVMRKVRALTEASGLGELDLTSRELLTFIGEADSNGAPVRHGDIVRAGLFGTAPTVQGRLATLECGGWIESEKDPCDGRSRLIRPSRQSRKFFSKVSAAIRTMASD